MKAKEGICIVSFSNNSDHQEFLYSLYTALKGKTNAWTVGIRQPKATNACYDEHNIYVDCPDRPGVQADTFRLDRVLKIAALIRKMNVRFIYFESLHVWNIILMCLLRKTHICIEGIHDVIPHDNSKSVAIATNAACRAAHYVMIHNTKYVHVLHERYGVSEERIFTVGLWKDFPSETQPAHSGFFMNFGRIRKYKGLDLMEKVIKSTPNVTYLIAGSPDEESKPTVEQIRTCANADVIAQEVSVEDMEQLFTQADWIVLPYATATQSGVIIDAYRFSRPVICFNVGAVAEQVKDGVSGMLVEAGNADLFTQAIQKAASLSHDEYATYAHNAYVFGKELYSSESAANQLWEKMKQINS